MWGGTGSIKKIMSYWYFLSSYASILVRSFSTVLYQYYDFDLVMSSQT